MEQTIAQGGEYLKLKLKDVSKLADRLGGFVGNLNWSNLRTLGIALIGVMIFYFVMIQLWSITSTEYLPVGIADFVVRTPEEGFYERRANGACPTNETDLFNFSCFFH